MSSEAKKNEKADAIDSICWELRRLTIFRAGRQGQRRTSQRWCVGEQELQQHDCPRFENKGGDHVCA